MKVKIKYKDGTVLEYIGITYISKVFLYITISNKNGYSENISWAKIKSIEIVEI